MRLVNAIKPVSVNIGSKSFALRPSLKAAYLLSVREGGFERLLKELSENSFTAMHDVITVASGDEAASAFYNAVNARPLGKVIFDADAEFGFEVTPLNERLIAYLLALLDINSESRAARAPDQPAPKSKPQDFTPLLESLFEIATGWLGWSPDQAWSAAPSEIVAAHKGRVALSISAEI